MESNICKKFILLFIIILSCWETVLAQKESKDYVILKAGIKTEGKILTDFDFENYEIINFKSNDGQVVKYSPEDLQEFQFEKGRFFKSILLPEGIEPKFVQVLFFGEVSLYKWRDNYFAEKSGQVYALQIIKTEKVVDGKTRILKTNQFVGVLNLLMAGKCGVINEANWNPAKAKLNDHNLIRILQIYHDCENIPYEIFSEKIPAVILSPKAGVSTGNYQIVNGLKGVAGESYYSGEPLLGGYFGFKVHSIRSITRLGGELGVRYSTGMGQIDSKLTVGLNNSGKEEFDIQKIDIPLYVDYLLLRKKSTELTGGIGLIYMIQNTTSIFSIQERYGAQEGRVDQLETSFVSLKTKSLDPSLKIGLTQKIGNKIRVFGDFTASYLKKNFLIDMTDLSSSQDAVFFNFTIGIQYK